MGLWPWVFPWLWVCGGSVVLLVDLWWHCRRGMGLWWVQGDGGVVVGLLLWGCGRSVVMGPWRDSR